MSRKSAGKWTKQPYRIRWTGTAWQADVFIAQGHRVKKSFRGIKPRDPEAYKKAEKWAVALKADDFRGSIRGERPADDTPFKGIAAMFLDELQAAAANVAAGAARSIWTYRYYRHRLRRYIIPALPDGPARGITRSHIKDYINGMRKKGFGQDEINKHIQVLKRVFTWAIDQEILDASPAVGIKKEKAPRVQERRFYSVKEQDDILSRLTGQSHGFILAAFRAGLRRRELMNLDFSWVLWDRNLLCVPFSTKYRAKGRKERYIPLDANLKAWLKSLGRDIGPVFVTERRYKCTGGQKRVRALRTHKKLLNDIATAAGHRIKPQDCRHTFASTLLTAGLDMRYVQAVMGHASITTTEIYSHLAPTYLDDVHTVMATAWTVGKCPGSVPTLTVVGKK